MARYFIVTDIDNETVRHKVPEGWMPVIEDQTILFPDGSSLPLTSVKASRFESKRETPAKDRLVHLVESAKLQFNEEFDAFRNTIRDPDQTEEKDFDAFLGVNSAYTLWRTAENNLAKHEENVRKSAEAARKKKENPTPKAEAKPKAAHKKR